MASYTKAQQLSRGPRRKQSRGQDRKVYAAVTEASRNEQGQMVCSICGKPGKDDDMARDHRKTRGSGGKTTVENVRVTHVACHAERHSGGHA